MTLSINPTHPAAASILPDRVENIVLKTWPLGEKYFRLLRIGDKLETELIVPFGEHVRSPIEIPPNLSIEEAILHLMSLEPVEYPDNIICLKKPEQWIDPPRAHEPGRPGVFRSLLDQETFIDDNCWAITLVDTLRLKLDPTTWAGHAAILIEGVKNGEFFLKKAHLISGFGNAGEVKLTRIPVAGFQVDRINHKSASWTVSPVAAQYMLDHIQDEEAEIRAGRLKIILDPTANGATPFITNCFLWARDNLKWAGIDLYRGDSSQPSEASEAPVFYGPKALIAPIGKYSIFSKACVIVRVESPNGKFLDGVNMTKTLANQLGSVSWKIAKEPAKGFEIMPDARAILEASDPEIVFRDPVILSVQIAGEPDLRRIDVTEKVKRVLAEKLGREPTFCAIL